MLHKLLATASDLEHWADLLEGKSTFPELLRRLISRTTRSLTSISFSSAEGVQLGGWDGITTAEEATKFVPANSTGWELGTNKGQKGKADDDYETRTAEPLELKPSDATFIFCTPRRWGQRRKWAAARRGEGRWRDVRAYDADDLIAWLTESPATHIWLSHLLGKHPEGVQDLESWWDGWAAQTTPVMQGHWLLAGRSIAQNALVTWLTAAPATPQVHSLFASTADEARAFVASCLLALPLPERTTLLAQTVVVSSESAWQQLILFNEPLLLLVNFESERINQLQAAATRQGHRVLLPRAANELRDGYTAIPPLQREALQQALEQASFTRLDAAEKASLARRSFTAFHRTLLTDKSLHHLWWQDSGVARQLLPLLLLNRWQTTSPGDQLVVEMLSGQPYQAMETLLRTWAQQPAAPVRLLDREWFILDPADVWEQTAAYLTSDLLKSFSEVVQHVLGAPLARFDLAPDERRFAGLRGPQDDYSNTLRHGLTTSLALLSTHTPPAAPARRVPGWVGGQVHQLVANALQDANGYLLASLDNHLPPLAEAAPDVFLSTILQGLRNSAPALVKLFEEEAGLFHSTAHHTGLLWALEGLAWPPQYFPDATLALAILTRLDPGGQLANRPINSLRTIFLTWRPQTNASVEERLTVLDRIQQMEPEVSWRLLKLLLPSAHDTSFGTHVPTFQWRDWGVNPDQRTPIKEYHNYLIGLTERVLHAAGTIPQRWGQLMGELPEWMARLPNAGLRKQVLAALSQLASVPLSESDRLTLLQELRDLLNRHRSFKQADWTWSEAQLAPLALLYEELQPSDLISRHAWLFEQWPKLPEGIERRSSADAEEVISKRQEQALSEILAALGNEAISQLLPVITNPFWLGRICGQSTHISDAEKLQLFKRYAAAVEEREADFGRGLASSFILALGEENARIEVLSENIAWQPNQAGIWLANMPMKATTWHLAKELGPEVVAEYWKRAWHYVKNDAEAPEAVQNFLTHGRPEAAANVLTMLQHHDNERLPASLVLATLEALLAAQLKTDQPLVQRYELETLLSELPYAPVEYRSQAIKLAFLFSSAVPLENPQLLNEELERNPAFYIELLEGLYKPDNASETEIEALPEQEREIKQLFASQAWSILHHWESVPGVQPNGTLDGPYLHDWVNQARELASEKRIIKGFDIQLGLLLSHAPVGTDGVWPPQAVCQLLEEEGANETVARHIHMGRYNIHGRTHTVDGGRREENLAADYANWAQKLQTRYPTTARILRGLHNDFKAQAENERHRADREDQFGY
ncbi:hypothetical protein I2I05_19145 [Hymenobacter sp. BT683]|uniref:Uncharacterized protein n=1 Tax=Hymenobacter jeongseonensis TaxID=2791027 RepID=A0ABS0IMF2_9BACT|nr:hypothetical protein [Hymenobacter jeongseonensis]MBF9239518.1 hypothetical protein [Hymenobacter jeongseonensis]